MDLTLPLKTPRASKGTDAYTKGANSNHAENSPAMGVSAKGDADELGMGVFAKGDVDELGMGVFAKGDVDELGMGVFAKGDVDELGMGVSAKGDADELGMGVSVKGGAGGLGVGVSANVGADELGVGVSAKGEADDLGMGVFASANVVMSVQDKVILGFWLVRAALDVALSRGANKNKLLRGTGIFDDALQSDSLLSIKQYSSLLGNVDAQTKSSDVSFMLGGALASQWQHSPLHVLAACENVEALLFHLTHRQTFRWCNLPLCQFQRFESANNIVLVPQLTGVSSKLSLFAIEMAFASIVSLLRSIANKRIRLSFTFTGSRPKNIADYETHLGLTLSFNSPFNSICIEKDVLLQPLKSISKVADVSEPQVSSSYLVDNSLLGGNATLSKSGPLTTLQPYLSLPDFVRHYIDAFSAQTANTGLPELAGKLGISVATLKRKLKEFGVSFRSLSEEVHRNHAVMLLSVNKVSNEFAAGAMGINDSTNFRRTVKRLTGKTPSELRG
ncbi:AraC family transcriptional regulator ligand-binding domain-containing protein [Alteromonas sp. 4B03]|uniref:AraC family transcriptional regulator n=2 Tax=unclassified Alteromonas TaxID=2614992 RepID=UPI003D2D8CAA